MCQHNRLAQRERGLEYYLVGAVRLAVLRNIYRLWATTSHILPAYMAILSWMCPRSDSLRAITGNKVTQVWTLWALWIPFSFNSVWLFPHPRLYSPLMMWTCFISWLGSRERSLFLQEIEWLWGPSVFSLPCGLACLCVHAHRHTFWLHIWLYDWHPQTRSAYLD